MKFNVQNVARKIGVPVQNWKGRCYDIACLLVEKGVVKGKPRYGDWLGPFAPASMFASRSIIGFTHHGWVEMLDKRICDPTRWVFEAVEPYIYVGRDLEGYYDFGGNKLRESRLTPAPKFNPDDPKGPIDFPKIPTVVNLLRHMPPYTDEQLFWLANVPLKMFGRDAKEIFQAYEKLDLAAYIPIDNYRYVMDG